MIVKVVEQRFRFIALMTVTGPAFGYWDTLRNRYEKWSPPSRQASAAAAGAEPFCPMHPSVVRDGPGGCPICGMPLSKRSKGGTPPLPEGVTGRVALAPFHIVQGNIKTEEVRYAPLVATLTSRGTACSSGSRSPRPSSPPA